MNGRKLQFIFQGGVEEIEWGRGSLLRDLGKKISFLCVVVVEVIYGYPFSPGVGGLESVRSMWRDSTWDVDRVPTILSRG